MTAAMQERHGEGKEFSGRRRLARSPDARILVGLDRDGIFLKTGRNDKHPYAIVITKKSVFQRFPIGWRLRLAAYSLSSYASNKGAGGLPRRRRQGEWRAVTIHAIASAKDNAARRAFAGKSRCFRGGNR